MTPVYKIYWSEKAPHCADAIQVKQINGKVAYVCRHPCCKPL